MDHTLATVKPLEMLDHLPEGYISRPARMEDLDGVIETINAATRDLIGVDKFTVADYKVDWELPAFNLDTGTRLVLSPDGEVAGIYEFWDIYDPYTRFVVWGRVHPRHEGKGVGSHLLAWVDHCAAQAIEKSPPGARVVLHAFVPSIIQGADALFVDNGYSLIRHSLRMVIDLDGTPPVPDWPTGIKVRSMRVGEEEAQVIRAVRESFKDHWGYIEGSFEEEYERWMHRIHNDEHFDPALWFLAMDGEEIAGISLCWGNAFDDPDMGWVGTLGVRRPWRRRGLGLALLQYSFAEFYRLGKPRAGLGVDAQNLTGAMRLYTKAGMRSDTRHQHSIYEKELRPGVELSTQTVED
jgi:mycothiol synthase